MDVSEASISNGIALRYATAIFELARDEKALDALDKDRDFLLGDMEEGMRLFHQARDRALAEAR